MLATFRVQTHDSPQIAEYVTYTRESVYQLILLLEASSTVEAYQVFGEGKQIKDIHLTYSFSQTSVNINKFISERFEW